LAVANYENANGHLPPACVLGPDGRPWHSWRVLILPYLEHDDVFKQYRFDEPWDGPNNRMLADRMPKIFRFSGDPPNGPVTNYLAVVGPETAWPGESKRTLAEITDGPSRTALIVENRGANVHWMEPRDLPFDGFDVVLNRPNGLSSPYDAPANVTVDGTITRLHKTITPETIRALLTARGGEPLTDANGQWDVIPDGRIRERK
jgi:hypothetical protein